MPSKGYLFDKKGALIDEIDSSFQYTYKLSGVEACKFAYPSADDKFIEENFRAGNFLAVFPEGGKLPGWGGRLDLPNTWGAGQMQATALSGEDQFNQRIGNPNVLLRPVTGTGGSLFRELVREANALEDTLLREGNIYDGGPSTGIMITPGNWLMTTLSNLVQRTGGAFEVTPLVVENQLTLQAHWYQGGRFVNESLNNDNCDVIQDSLSETGPIYNYIFAYGSELPGGARVYYTAVDEASRDKYGLRMKPLSVNADDLPTVTAAAQAEVAKLAWPRKVFKARVKSDAHAAVRRNNVLMFENSEIAFGREGKVGVQTYVKILQFKVNDEDPENVETTIIEQAGYQP